MIVKVLLNRGTLAATLMTMVLFAVLPAQAQTRLAAAYDFARLKNDGGNMHGLAITGDRVIWGEYLTVSGILSHARGKNDLGGMREVWEALGIALPDLSMSMTYIGVGPGGRFDTGKVQVFGHVLLGALRTKVDYNIPGVDSDIPEISGSDSGSDSDTSYDEIRIGGGIDIPFSDRGFAHIGVASDDAATHVMVGASFRF